MPGNNRGDALAIGFGEAGSFSITSPGSHYFEVQLEEGTTYSIDVSLGTLEYSVLALKNIQGATLEYVVITGDRDAARIVWTATGSGSYFVEMYGPRGPGSYTLTVTDGESPRSTPAAPQLIETPIPTATPSPSAPALVFASVSAGGQHSCGVTTTGDAYCWGQNAFGQLGNGDSENASQTTPVAVSGGLTFASVSAGKSHTCGVTVSSIAYCWGQGIDGKLGNGSTDSQGTPVAVLEGLTFASVSAGWKHTCGVTTGAAAYCWGNGPQGKLGNGSTDSQSTPVAVSGGLAFASVSAGWVHTCGVTTGGAAYCWGENGGSHLGNKTSTTQRLPPATTRIPVPVLGGLTFASVSAGEEYTCGVTTGGGAFCWGRGAFGKLGNGTEDRVWTPEDPVSGRLAFTSISAHTSHTCGVTTSGAAYCWGNGNWGKLGNGTEDPLYNQTTPVAVSGELAFTSVSVGEFHNCGVTTSGTAYCWGAGSTGELGNGSTDKQTTPVAVGPPA